MRLFFIFSIAFLLLPGCITERNKILDEFAEVNTNGWSWSDAKSFSFEITEPDYLYNLECALRITGSYKYSNIWMLYTLDGPNDAKKNQFQIQLSDNTGKWLGNGKSNLISYKTPFLQNIRLKKGKYTLKFNQNMRDEKLGAVSDIGLKIYKGNKVY